MTPFAPFTSDPSRLRAELAAFETFLGPDTRELTERDAIIPFFKLHLNLAGLIGQFNSVLIRPNLIKPDLEFFGDHACDLAIGNGATGQFCFVEFEEAKAESVFKKSGRGVREWSARFEHGFSQIVDWFHTLDDMKNTGRFRGQFGTNLADYVGVLVAGRRGFLDAHQRDRLRWRSLNVQVAGKRVHCLTFDDLADMLRACVDLLVPTVP